MRKRKAYFGNARRKARHYPKLIQRSWFKKADPVKVASWIKPLYDRALQMNCGFSEVFYPTIAVRE